MSDGSGQEIAEVIDGDKVDAENFPPETPLGVPELLGKDVTVAGDHAPDSLAEREAREEPDVVVADDDPVGEVVESDAGTDLAAELDEPDPDDVTFGESEASGEDLPAEVAALHVDEG